MSELEPDSPTKLAAMVRFHISELRERNAHHAFEDVCFELARRRIASNIVRATGPVSQGGDQGRDFETFHTYFSRTELPQGSFLGLVSAEAIAFTCTLQSSRIEGKIRGDVRTIVKLGTPIRRVYAFLGEALAVSKRHDLIKDVLEEFNVHLEVFDRHAIADLLCDTDVFWIAVEHLQIPAEMTPSFVASDNEIPAWYSRKLQTWSLRRQSSSPASSWGDLVDLRRCLNFSLFDAAGRRDIDLWSEAFKPLLETEDRRLRQMARYSICVSRYRGGSSAAIADRLVGDFCADLRELADPGLMADAAVLLTYLSTAILTDWSDLSPQACRDLQQEVREIAADLLRSSQTPGLRAQYIGVEVSLCLSIDTVAAAAAHRRSRKTKAVTLVPPAQYLGREIIEFPSSTIQLVDAEGALRALSKLLISVEHAPLFPIELTADYFDLLSPALVDLPGYADVRAGLDDTVARQTGRSVVADRCRTRASYFLQSNRPFDALRELHEAKVQYWNGETVEEALKCLVLIAGVYKNIRLVWAAKMYSLAAAAIAGGSGNPLLLHVVPRGLLYAAECDASGGALFTSAATASIGLRAQLELTEDPWDVEVHTYMMNPVQTLASIYAYFQEAGSERIVEEIKRVNDETGVQGIVETILDAQPTGRADDVASIVQEYSCVAPADIGSERLFSWASHGVSWTVRCNNDAETVVAAEGFAAALQIVIAEIGQQDPVFLLATADFAVTVRDVEQASITEDVSSATATARWKVVLPTYTYAPLVNQTNQRDIAIGYLAAASHALRDLSALPWTELEKLLSANIGPDILSKLIVGRPSSELFSYLEQDRWDCIHSLREELVQVQDGRASSNPEIPAMVGHGPGYTRERALEQVSARYRRVMELFPFTVRRITESPETRQLLYALKAKGWLDWHILTAIANIRVNHRLSTANAADVDLDTLTQEAETADELALPSSLVTEESLQLALEASAHQTLEGWGLTVNRNQVPMGSALELLKARFGYAEDDVAHDALFE